MSDSNSNSTGITIPKNFTAEQAEKILLAADQLNQWRANGASLAKCSLLEVWVAYLSMDEGARPTIHPPDDISIDLRHVVQLIDEIPPTA